MTETNKRTGRSQAESVEDLDAKIQEMEAELAQGYGKPLTWDEVTSATPEDLARKEQRRSVLPRLITAAKIKRLELRRAGYERDIEPLQAKREAAYERIEAATAHRLEAEAEEGKARSEWSDANMRIQSREDRIREVTREIRELREGGR
jgi:chromosome segregation ATPase